MVIKIPLKIKNVMHFVTKLINSLINITFVIVLSNIEILLESQSVSYSSSMALPCLSVVGSVVVVMDGLTCQTLTESKGATSTKAK